jgi:hypothetical protein
LAVWIQAAIAGFIAAIVGFAEIVTRYRSDPRGALKSPAAWAYLALNWGTGVAALFLVNAFGWKFGQTGDTTAWRILVSGFGALALFRSSLFVAKIGGSDVPVGPSVVVEALLNACDREVDRKCAEGIAEKLRKEDLTGLNQASTATNLPVLCLSLMQNFQPSDQALLGAELNKIQTDQQLAPEAKVRAIVIQLSKFLGPDFVLDVIRDSKTLLSQPPQQAADGQAEVRAVLNEVQRLLGDPVPPLQPRALPSGEAHEQPRPPTAS